MTSTLVLLAYLPPALLLLTAFLGRRTPGRRPWRVYRAGMVGALLALLLSLLGGGTLLAGSGPLVSPILGWGELGLAARIDALSMLMVWLVGMIAVFVLHFSRNYLDGDPRHGIFLGRLSLTIGAVLLLVTAGNLFQLVVGWTGTSIALHHLLVFYRHRPVARSAARKKFVVARAADVSLIAAALLIQRAFGSGDLGTLADRAGALLPAGDLPAGVGAATILVVIAAALKSAMFPFHGWLLEVMETPTPVSALLHAGLLNAGTFLVVRLGDIMVLSPAALVLLIGVGGFTALFASSAMISQSSVKISLAYSSAAHMGFMLMLCGFGAHSVAIVHLIAHSFYKAHAFLSSGSVVEYIRGVGTGIKPVAATPARLLVALVGALAVFVTLGTLLGIDLTKRPGEMALGAIFVMAMTHLLLQGLGNVSRRAVVSRVFLGVVAVTLAFFALELSAAWLLADAVAPYPPPGPLTNGAMIAAVIAFGLIILLQTMLPAMAQSPAWRAAYVHLKNGFYANALFDRLIGALRQV